MERNLYFTRHSRRPSKPPSRNVEHDRGEPSGSAALAARRAGHPWSEQMICKKSRKVRETRSSRSQKRSKRGQKYWQRVELGIHCLNRWTVKCLEMSRKRVVHAAENGPSEESKRRQRVELGIRGLNGWTVNCMEVYEKRGVHAAINARKTLATVLPPLATRHFSRSTPLAAVRKLALFSGSISPWFVLSHNIPMINTDSNWLCS